MELLAFLQINLNALKLALMENSVINFNIYVNLAIVNV